MKKNTQIIYLSLLLLLLSGCNIKSLPSNPFKKEDTINSHADTAKTEVVDSHKESQCGYELQVDQALSLLDLEALKVLLPKIERRSSCTLTYLDWLKREMSGIAVNKAKSLIAEGKVEEAEKWIQSDYAPVKLWSVQALHGELAAMQQRWENAAYFYNQALDFIADPNLTPQKPTTEETENLFNLAAEAQLLVGRLPVDRSGNLSGILRSSQELGIKIVAAPIPVQFVFGKTALTSKGEEVVNQLILYIQKNSDNTPEIILVGHTDEIGDDSHNCDLSKNRALMVKNKLIAKGVTMNITTLGKGEREPFKIMNPERYTTDEINQINRRVDIIKDNISDNIYDNVCQ